MKRSIRIALAVALIPLTLGLTAFGHAHSRTPEQKRARAEEWVKDKLDLDEGQEAKFAALGQEALALGKDLRGGHDADFDAILEAVEGNLDRTFVDGIVAKRRATFDEHLPALLDRLVAFQTSLNSEQKQEVGQFLQKMRVFNRDQIIDRLRGTEWAATDRAVDVLASRLRQKLGDDPRHPRFIQTVWGTGY